MTLSLFGDDPPRKKERPKPKPNGLSPWFDQFAALLGPLTVRNSRGRLAAVITGMIAAGLAPADVQRIPAVVRQYAAWRTLDVSTVHTCWVWLVEPPATNPTPAGPLQLMDAARTLNGGADPF